MEKIKHIRLGSLTLLAFFLFFFSLNGSADAWHITSISGTVFFVVTDIGYVGPTLTTHWLYNQDGDVWYVYPNGSLTCEFTPYSPNESAILYAFVSWYVNGTNSTGNYSQFEVNNSMVTTVTLGPDVLNQDELWDCVVLINDTVEYSPIYTTSPRYSIYVVPYSVPLVSNGSMHLSLYVLFIVVALLCVVLDIFADVPYLGVFGGIMFILMGTFMAFDVPQIYRVFCESQYNQTGTMCITRLVTIEPTMNTGISAMLWIIGLGIILEAIYFRVNQVDREEV